jgi:dipeptidyl aminopeptidase/acylaminoacyl peptidase
MAYPNDEQYLVPFGKDPAVWRATSPMYYVRKGIPPMLIYVGERTYPSIKNSSEKFRQQLIREGVQHTIMVMPGRKHVGMVLQLYWKNNRIYRDLLKFVKAD